MATWPRGIACAAALVMALPAAVRANERFRGDKVVPLSPDGREALDLEVGPILFQELLVDGAPMDPEAIAARPPDERFAPHAVVVVSHRGQDEAELQMAVTFLDAEGTPVLRCARTEDQDEQTAGLKHALCREVSGVLKDWARVTQVRFEARVEED